MAFDAPTRLEFVAVVRRALRDTATTAVFPVDTINDFISQGLQDLSMYRPKETVRSATWNAGAPIDPLLTEDMTAVWQVAARSLDPSRNSARVIPFGDHGDLNYTSGWDFWQGMLSIPRLWSQSLDGWAGKEAVELVVWGYADRTLPTADGSVLDLQNNTDLLCLQEFCKRQGFDNLQHDRALYQQWIAQVNNTDVSPTQLSGMATMAEQSYERMRSRSTVLRRRPTTYARGF